MDLKSSATGLFDDLKDRIGGLTNRSHDQRDDEYYQPYTDEGYVDEPYEPDMDYGPYGYESNGESRYRSTSSNGIRPPELVTSEEIARSASNLGYAARNAERESQAAARVPVESTFDSREYAESATRASFESPYRTTSTADSSYSGVNQVFDRADDHPASTGSAGLDGLFMPTTPAQKVAASTRRQLRVIKPMSYSDAEVVATTVKAGDVAVLYLRLTNEALITRILDFSFGVAAALGANVDFISDQVFVIVKGGELTLEENHELRQQGIL